MEFKMDFTKYLVENAYVLIPVLYILGNVLKDLKFIADKYIPLLLLVLGILLSCAWLGFDMAAVIQGILLTGVTVYSNQVIKQILKKETFIADISLEAINKTNEVKKEVQTEATTTAINNEVREKSTPAADLNASSKIVVDIPVEG